MVSDTPCTLEHHPHAPVPTRLDDMAYVYLLLGRAYPCLHANPMVNVANMTN